MIQDIELKNDLVATYNEVEEVLADFEQLTDEELIEVKEAIKNRLKMALQWLGKYVSDEDIITDLEKTNVQFYVATYEALEGDEQPFTEVLAVFVDEWELQDDELLYTCYVHNGQHSICSQSFLAEKARKATEIEYKELFDELEKSVGYNLNIV